MRDRSVSRHSYHCALYHSLVINKILHQIEVDTLQIQNMHITHFMFCDMFLNSPGWVHIYLV